MLGRRDLAAFLLPRLTRRDKGDLVEVEEALHLRGGDEVAVVDRVQKATHHPRRRRRSVMAVDRALVGCVLSAVGLRRWTCFWWLLRNAQVTASRSARKTTPADHRGGRHRRSGHFLGDQDNTFDVGPTAYRWTRAVHDGGQPAARCFNEFSSTDMGHPAFLVAPGQWCAPADPQNGLRQSVTRLQGNDLELQRPQPIPEMSGE